MIILLSEIYASAKDVAKSSGKFPPKIVQSIARMAALAISKIFWFIRFSGTENIPRDSGGLLLAANHATYIDPVWISIPIKRPLQYMAWDQAFNWFLIGPLIRYLGAFPVKHGAAVTKTAVADAIAVLRSGATLIVFPEGQREFADGELLEFKTGAAHIAQSAGVPILPVTIRGGNRVWPQGKKYPRLFRKVEIIYHPPLVISSKSERENKNGLSETMTRKLSEVIQSGLN